MLLDLLCNAYRILLRTANINLLKHRLSNVRPFVAVNCTSMDRDMCQLIYVNYVDD